MRTISALTIFGGVLIWVVIHYSFWVAFSVFLMGWMLAITLAAFTVKN